MYPAKMKRGYTKMGGAGDTGPIGSAGIAASKASQAPSALLPY